MNLVGMTLEELRVEEQKELDRLKDPSYQPPMDHRARPFLFMPRDQILKDIREMIRWKYG